MSEEDRSFSDIEEEKIEGFESDQEAGERVDSTEEASLEEMEEEDEDDEEEESTPEGVIGEEIEEEEEEEIEIEEESQPKVRRGKKKAKAKESKQSVTNVEKQLEKQATYLTKLEQELQPLRRLTKVSDSHSKLIKEINTSVKQIGRQIVQIQKGIQKQKGKAKSKSKPKSKGKAKSKSKPKSKNKRK